MTVTLAFDYFREALSEFMATAAFVFLMCGTGLSTRNPTNSYGIDLTAHFAVSLANGLAAAFVIYCFGNVRCAQITKMCAHRAANGRAVRMPQYNNRLL